MKKLISAVLALTFAAALVGCGSKAPASSTASSTAPASSAAIEAASEAATDASSINLEDMVNAIQQANAVANPRTIDDFSIENDFLLSKDDIVSYYGIMSNDQGNSALILAVECVDGKADSVKTTLENYKQNQVAYYGNYAEFADGQAAIQDGRVVAKGNCVVIVFANTEGASYSDIDSAITSALG